MVQIPNDNTSRCGGFPAMLRSLVGVAGTLLLVECAALAQANYQKLFTFGDPDGYAVLWNSSMPATTNPQFPLGIIQGTDGPLYGVSGNGGALGKGTAFKLNTDGTLFSVIHEFGQNADPYPTERLVEGADGFLYGVTQQGVLFKLSKDGSSYSILKNLLESPHQLVEGDDEMLYGVTSYGEGETHGSVFRIKKDGGTFAQIYSFTGQDGDGALPNSGLLKGSDGAFYGTTMLGGKRGPNGELTYSYGTVFVIRSGLRIGVQLSPAGAVLLSSAGVPNTSYTFQSVMDISSTNWTAIGTSIADTNGLIVFEGPVLATNRTRFFRVSQP